MEYKNEDFFAGSLQTVETYQAYIPNKINHDFKFIDNRTYKLLEDASMLLGKLNELNCSVEFYNIFTNMHVYLEAHSSSEIEGTWADIKDLLNIDINKKNINQKDTQKVKNLYDTTYNFFTNKIKIERTYSIKTFKKINKALFEKIEPENKFAGKLRDVQNYVGGNNSMNALFIPPPPNLVKDLLEDLNDFWYNESFYIPNLIKIALYHFQLETIHPFTDGNGRMGRLLINLQLKDVGLLSLPVLCLSNYWKKNKGLYYEALSIARFSNNLEHWVRFFLNSIKEASEERISTIQKICELGNNYTNKIKAQFKNPINHMKFLEYLIKINPFVTAKEAQKVLGLTYQGANKIIDNFITLGILKETSSHQRNRCFIFEEYHDLIFNLIEKD